MKLFTFQISSTYYKPDSEDVSMAEIDIFANTREKAEKILENFVGKLALKEFFSVDSVVEQ